MLTYHKIVRGNTSPVWHIGVLTSAAGVEPKQYADLSSGFSCVIACATANPPIERPVTALAAGNEKYRAFLTPAEMLQLAPGKHVVAIQITNPTNDPPLRREKHLGLEVFEQIIQSS